MKNKFAQLFATVSPKKVAVITIACGLLIAIIAYTFVAQHDSPASQPVTKGNRSTTAPAPSEASATSTATPDDCPDKDCLYSEDAIYAKARVAAQKIADAQNELASADPYDSEAIDKNFRILDKYLGGTESYLIADDGSRRQTNARVSWISPRDITYTWILPDDNDETKYNAIIDRGITILCITDTGEILSEVFLGWGEPTGKTDARNIVETGNYIGQEKQAAEEYLQHDYLSFTAFHLKLTHEGGKALGF